MMKTSAEYQRDYRTRKRAGKPPKPPPKTGKERIRAYRMRQRLKKNATHQFNDNQSSSTSASMRRDFGVDAHTLQPGQQPILPKPSKIIKDELENGSKDNLGHSEQSEPVVEMDNDVYDYDSLAAQNTPPVVWIKEEFIVPDD